MTTQAIILDELNINELLRRGVSESDGDQTPQLGEALSTPDESAPVDEALPENDGRDSIKLFAQSPEKLFLHWSHAGDPAAALQKAFGDAASQYRLVVRLFEVGNGEELIHETTPERALWLEVLPGRDYRADVGFHAEGLPYITLLSSAVVHTPRASVSPNADSSPEFQLTATEFAHILEQTGYPPCAVEDMTQHDLPAAPSSSFCHTEINASSSKCSQYRER